MLLRPIILRAVKSHFRNVSPALKSDWINHVQRRFEIANIHTSKLYMQFYINMPSCLATVNDLLFG